MTPTHRPGRPKAPLPPPETSFTRQVRRLVDEAHRGNLREAASHSGLAYGTLRDLYAGRSGAPSLATLEDLTGAYSLPLAWFLAEGEMPPLTAIVGILPPDPELGRGRQRRIGIPLAAWPLARLFLRLEPYLRSLPPAVSRPILGVAPDPESCRERLTSFLLSPLLEAQAAGQLLLLDADPPFRGAEHPSPEQRLEWIELLRELGTFWSRALSGLLRRAEGG